MNPEFKECLRKKKIIAFPMGKRLINKELNSAQEDLDDAQFGLTHGKYKWSTIQGYYSMYHTARALLFSREYREKSHYCLYVAIKALFVETGVFEIGYAEAFYHVMILRENADYRSRFSKTGAKLVLKRAEEFLSKSREILK
jgi:uncharacterized protein (UPF0332 family)